MAESKEAAGEPEVVGMALLTRNTFIIEFVCTLHILHANKFINNSTMNNDWIAYTYRLWFIFVLQKVDQKSERTMRSKREKRKQRQQTMSLLNTASHPLIILIFQSPF